MPGKSDLFLDAQSRDYLKLLAHWAIRDELGLPASEPAALDAAVLDEKCGAFVTLKKDHQLRGCIGYIEAYRPLRQTIQQMALAAAFQDPRFPPLVAAECENLEIEISVLSPLRTITDPDLVEPGRHGIYIVNGSAAGLLLPQVATEYGWGREEFLSQTCHKAGLAGNCWRHPDTVIRIFTAEVF